MKVLALELSTARGSIALRDDEGASLVREFPADRKHSGLFFENLSALRSEAGLPEVIVVGLGPGSYAGIRIAIATALGLRAAAGARMVGRPSICAFDRPEYCAVGDARRGDYFFSHVQEGRVLEGPRLASDEELRTLMEQHRDLPFLAAEPLPRFTRVTPAYPSAQILAGLVQPGEDDETLEPIYLRQPYITTPKPTPWTR